jgi:hypothetical protein
MNPRDIRQDGWVTPAAGAGLAPASPPLTRLRARLLASRYDRMLAVGVVGPRYSALEAHARRLVTVAEREVVARSFMECLREARQPLTAWTARSWTHRPNVLAAADLIDKATLRLHSPRPVDPRGMARLRLLLGDGTGPLYVLGGGDLSGRLQAALAAL